MEKKGDLLNQLAIISDLIENMNVVYENARINIKLSEDKFNEIFTYMNNKNLNRMDIPKNTFLIKIGDVEISFNKNNV